MSDEERPDRAAPSAATDHLADALRAASDEVMERAQEQVDREQADADRVTESVARHREERELRIDRLESALDAALHHPSRAIRFE